MSKENISGSFRDPSGFLFSFQDTLYRQINDVYKDDYNLLMDSGLYADLTASGLLVTHEEVELELDREDQAYKIIQPRLVPFISYPYEWSFSQLKDAALTTLKIQKKALEFGMVLKDSSAYNIQFMDGKPIFIDTLSFEKYKEGRPWVAYRQFCQHFLAPLALMKFNDIRMNQFFRVFIDGVPLDLASALLPLKTKFSFSLLTHIHLHAKSQRRYADKAAGGANAKISRHSLLALIDNLAGAVKKMNWRPAGTEWADYYNDTNYNEAAFNLKKNLVSQYLDMIEPTPNIVWDLGANVGVFSRLAAERGIRTLSYDIDPAAVEKNYRLVTEDGDKHILPLLLDLTNPSPELGWENRERDSFLNRGPADAVMALALIHHLAISNNVPLLKLARFFAKISKWLIIEFVPKQDSQVQRLLATREDIFNNYTQVDFENEFKKAFKIYASTKISGTERALFLMRNLHDEDG